MARIGVAYISVDADLSAFQRRLEELRTKNTPTVTVEVKADVDQASFKKAQAEGGQLGGREEVKVSADVNASSFARAKAAQATLTKESTKMSDVFNRSTLSIGQQTGALAGLLPVLVDVTGAAGALASSASAAALGVSALAVGGVGAASVGLAGLASVAVPAVASLKDLKTAQDAYTLAVQQYGKHSTEARTAFSKLRVEQKKAGPEAAKFAGNLSAISRRFKDLTASGRQDLFGGLNEGLDKLNQKLPLLAKSANSSVSALRGGFHLFFTEATGPQFTKFIQVMTRTFANSITPLADAFANIALILERIAVAVGPDVVRVLKQFDVLTQKWLISTANAGQLRDTIHQMVNQTETWLKLIGAAGKLLIAVLVPGAGQGQKAVKGITNQLKEWTKWVNAHPREIRDFFKEALKTTGLLAQTLVSFIPELFQISVAMRPIARAFLAITKALNTLKIGNVTALTALLGAFVAGRIIKSVAGFVTALNSVRVAYEGIRTAAAGAAVAETAATMAQGPGGAFGGVPKAGFNPAAAGGAFGGAAKPAAAADIGATTSKLTAFSRAAGGAALAITALVGAVEVLRTNFLGIRSIFVSVYNRGIKPLGKAFKDLGDALTGGHINEVFRAMGSALKALKGPLVFAVKNFTKLIGVLAVGAFAAILAPVVALTVALRIQLKVLTFLVKAFLHLPKVAVAAFGAIKSAAASAAGFVRDRWHDLGHALVAPFKLLKSIVGPIINFIIGKIRAAIGIAKKLQDALPKPGVSIHHIGPVPVPVPHFAQGGIVPQYFAGGGFARRGTDTVPAMLSPGELVLSKDQVKRLQQGTNLALDPKIVKETQKRAKDTAEGLTTELAKGHKKATDDTKKFKGTHDDLLNKLRQQSNNDVDNLVQHTVQGFQKAHEEATQQTGSMKKGVVADYQNMASGAIQGIKKLFDATNKALKALGVKPVKFGVSDTGSGGQKPSGKQTGGMVVPGSGPGDKVHMQAMVEPGERVFVLNRNASSALANLENLNSRVPRFQQGGIIDRTGIPHFAAGGGMAAMIADANRFERHHFPYQWGGGHSGFVNGSSPVDCSGAVSDVLHAAGLLNAPMVSGDLMSWGKAGKGPLTVYANPVHTVMSLNGRTFGTSASNPGGGAGWIDAPGASLAPGAVRTMDVKGGAMVGALKRVILQGAVGPLLDMAQAGVDLVHGAANKYLAKKTPAGTFGGGQPAAHGGWNRVGATYEGLTGHAAPGGGVIGGMNFAELLVAGANAGMHPNLTDLLGYKNVGYGMKYGSPLNIRMPGSNKQFTITKNDSGSGQQGNVHFKIDLQDAIIKKLGWSGNADVDVSAALQRGGLLPYLGKFHDGGIVPFDGMGMLQGGEVVLPKMAKGGGLLDLIPGWDHLNRHQRIRALNQILEHDPFLTPHQTKAYEAAKRRFSHIDIARATHLIPGFEDASFKKRIKEIKQVLKDPFLTEAQKKVYRAALAEQKELSHELKELRKELKDHHRLRAATQANEAAALRAVTNLVGSQIGFSANNKRRLAAGSTRSY